MANGQPLWGRNLGRRHDVFVVSCGSQHRDNTRNITGRIALATNLRTLVFKASCILVEAVTLKSCMRRMSRTDSMPDARCQMPDTTSVRMFNGAPPTQCTPRTPAPKRKDDTCQTLFLVLEASPVANVLIRVRSPSTRSKKLAQSSV
jgi:hypothetical protein